MTADTACNQPSLAPCCCRVSNSRHIPDVLYIGLVYPYISSTVVGSSLESEIYSNAAQRVLIRAGVSPACHVAPARIGSCQREIRASAPPAHAGAKTALACRRTAPARFPRWQAPIRASERIALARFSARWRADFTLLARRTSSRWRRIYISRNICVIIDRAVIFARAGSASHCRCSQIPSLPSHRMHRMDGRQRDMQYNINDISMIMISRRSRLLEMRHYHPTSL